METFAECNWWSATVKGLQSSSLQKGLAPWSMGPRHSALQDWLLGVSFWSIWGHPADGATDWHYHFVLSSFAQPPHWKSIWLLSCRSQVDKTHPAAGKLLAIICSRAVFCIDFSAWLFLIWIISATCFTTWPHKERCQDRSGAGLGGPAALLGAEGGQQEVCCLHTIVLDWSTFTSPRQVLKMSDLQHYLFYSTGLVQ